MLYVYLALTQQLNFKALVDSRDVSISVLWTKGWLPLRMLDSTGSLDSRILEYHNLGTERMARDADSLSLSSYVTGVFLIKPFTPSCC